MTVISVMGLRKEVRKMSEIKVTGTFPLGKGELEKYEVWAKRNHPNAKLIEVKTISEEEVELIYVAPPIERIRRITGYLVGTLDRWNDAKRAEEHDRVKHDLE
jgi:hypothetical protein